MVTAACPEVGLIEIPYTAEATNGIAEIVVEAASTAFPNLIFDVIEIAPGSTVADGVYTLQLPKASPSGRWELTVTVTDMTGSASRDEASLDVVANPGCTPTLELIEVRQSNPVCPKDAKLTAEMVFENALAEVIALNITLIDPEGVEYESYEMHEAGSPASSHFFSRDGETVTVQAELYLPENARPGTWRIEADALVNVTSGGPFAVSEAGTFEVEAGPGDCMFEAPPVITIDELVVSGPVCPDGAELTVVVSAANERGIENITVGWLFGALSGSAESKTVHGVEVTETFTIPIGPDTYPGRYAVVAETFDESRRFSQSDVYFVHRD